MNRWFLYLLIAFALSPLFSFADNASCCIKYKVRFELYNGKVEEGYYIHETFGLAGDTLKKLMAIPSLTTIYNSKENWAHHHILKIYKQVEKVPLFQHCSVNGTAEMYGYFISPTNTFTVWTSDVKEAKIVFAENLCCPEEALANGAKYCACIPTCQVVTELSDYKIQLIKDVAPNACTYLHYHMVGGIAIYSYSDKYTPEQLRDRVEKVLELQKFDESQDDVGAMKRYEQRKQRLMKEKIIVFRFAVQV